MRKKAIAILVAGILFFLCIYSPAEVAPKAYCVEREVDLFTQKEPYSGRGQNVSSDAFALGENVILYALVKYKNWPAPNLLVAFHVEGPENPVQNVTFSRSSETNASGIAEISFTLPNNEEIGAGNWHVSCNVEIGGEIVSDYLDFRAGWIVEIVGMETMNEDFSEPQTVFTAGSRVGVKLVLRNIAMTEKQAAVSVSMYDVHEHLLDTSEITNFTVPPNNTLVNTYFRLDIPINAPEGTATIHANAYNKPVDEGGVPYCPEVSSNISIVIHDIAIVDVHVSSNVVYAGDIVEIYVTVKNFGRYTESFDVSAYCNSTLIQTLNVEELEPGQELMLVFGWCTGGVREGIYVISAMACEVPGEINVENNHFVDGFVEVKKAVSPVHDVAVADMGVSDSSVYEGETVEVHVTVENRGTETETFNVTLYYDSYVMAVLFVGNLDAGKSRVLTFSWNTVGVVEGNYTLKAEASRVEGEANTANNIYVDGTIEIKAAPPTLTHDVAVVHVDVSPTIVEKGGTVNIRVRVRNEGSFSESFNVTVFYDSFVIETRRVTSLSPGQETTLSVFWNTSDVDIGTYTIKAEASAVAGETDLSDNKMIDGTVEVVAAGAYRPPWPLWLLLLIIGLLALLGLIAIAIALYRRRQKKKLQKAFYSGWHAWFYNYDLRKKS